MFSLNIFNIPSVESADAERADLEGPQCSWHFVDLCYAGNSHYRWGHVQPKASLGDSLKNYLQGQCPESPFMRCF